MSSGEEQTIASGAPAGCRHWPRQPANLHLSIWRRKLKVLSNTGVENYFLARMALTIFLRRRECLKSGIAIPNLGDRFAFTPERGPKGLRAIGVKNAAARRGEELKE